MRKSTTIVGRNNRRSDQRSKAVRDDRIPMKKKSPIVEAARETVRSCRIDQRVLLVLPRAWPVSDHTPSTKVLFVRATDVSPRC